MELTPSDIASVDAGYWATLNEIKLQTGVFSFKNHEYQIEPMSENVRRSCDMKATQGGFTEVRIFKTIHGLRYRLLPQGALYLFPTNDDVQEFSKARFQPLISSNPNAIGQYVKSTDTASLKKVRDAFLYLRGARLSQIVEGEHKESTKLRSIPVDEVTYDEFDLMDEDVAEKARGRMGHSLVKGEHWLSNPTIPDYGIDKVFHKSDQRHWFRKCSFCGKVPPEGADWSWYIDISNGWICAEISFPECVKIRPDGTGYIGCNKCGREAPLWQGNDTAKWVPKAPQNTSYMVGRRWSQLTSVFNDPAEILEDYINPPQGNLGDVVRLRLGLPYIAAEDRLRQSDVFACCSSDMESAVHKGPCAMGVDVGKIKHVIIGARTGKSHYQILKTAQVSNWNDIHDLAKKFNVRSAVIDIRPYEDAARQFQSAEPYKIFLCEYKENTPQGTLYNENTGIVSVARTEIFDATHRLVTIPGQLTLPRESPDMREFAKQLCATAKVLETNKKTKLSVYRYKKLGEEHFRNALNYFYLAASTGRIATVNKYKKKKSGKCKNDYARV